MIGAVFSLLWGAAGVVVLYYYAAALLDLPGGDGPLTLGKNPLYIERVMLAVRCFPVWVRWLMFVVGPLVLMFFGAFLYVEMFSRIFAGMARWLMPERAKSTLRFQKGGA